MYQNTQKAYITIGPLECQGKSEITEDGGSCKSLKLQGRKTGFYLLERNNGSAQVSASKR